MGDNLINSVTTVAVAIVGIAIIAVLVSKQAQTGAVVQNVAEGFGSAIRAAVSPLSGFSGGQAGNYATSY